MAYEPLDESNSVGILPIGGLGRIGMNMMLLWVGEDYFLIDCGVLFADEQAPGADLVLPDLGYLNTISSKVRAIILTHGHEDHIGAIPHVLKVCPAPVYGTRFTLGLVQEKLLEHGMAGLVDTNPIDPESRVEIGAARFEFIRVTHSIPDCVSVLIDTPVGKILHTGDWKIDLEPVDDEHFDEERFRKAGDSGVLLLLSDSTNAMVPGWSSSERQAGRGLEEQIRSIEGRVFVAMFSSNIHRLRLLGDIAARLGRRICFAGRSLHSYARVAREVGIPGVPHPEVDLSHLELVPDHELLVCMTGSQAEPGSALFRAAVGTHPHIRFRRGDTVILSARFIPGNERVIHEMINNISRWGVNVITPKGLSIHASGHAHRDELRHMMDLVRPRFFVPIHGEYSFLLRQAELARQAGIENVTVIENGKMLHIEPHRLRLGQTIPLEPYYLDGTITGNADYLAIRDRSKAAYNGVVAVHLQVHRSLRHVSGQVQINTVGVCTDDGRHLSACKRFVEQELALLPPFAPSREICDACEMLVRRYFRRAVGKKPVVLVTYDEKQSAE